LSKSIKFKDDTYLDSRGVIYKNSKYNSYQKVSQLLRMQSCQIRLSSRYTQEVSTAWTDYKIKLDTAHYREGSNYDEQLWLTNNSEIKIGKGVNKVFILGQITHGCSKQGEFDIRIYNNGEYVQHIYSYIVATTFNNDIAYTILDVKEGDLISLHFFTGVVGTHTIYERTNLLVIALC